MDNLGAISKILGSLFYYPINHQHNHALVQALRADVDVMKTELAPLLNLIKSEEPEQLNQDFLNLFEGAGVMSAPPWGSVYLDKQEVIFGDSLLEYRAFLKESGIELDTGMREPEDQFGLMLLAVAKLVENGATQYVIKEAFEQHLLPWGFRYLELAKQHAQSQTYQTLATLTNQWLVEFVEEMQLTVAKRKLYR
ncbi:Tat proofreading chaperone DmsD [Ferrimonas lipolytica]|uniref:Tat proofreading chaperone DmsD n=1 Tax=Ferrimonas lipolytica TaxID=2724191 RepID=A0A6H1U9S1_9GAMM|nr:Tat proofreading chaperone DmsD [Ferrimonas lipolytica]QIZ75791.1 Tat proofreading chaperone DmsD [Ferrimonas lipolytica]